MNSNRAAREAAYLEEQKRYDVRRAHGNIQESLSQISREERFQAATRQKKAGITDPAKSGFARDLPPEREVALARIWESGQNGKRLYVRIGKGLAVLSWQDVIELSKREDIERLAEVLTQGLTLKEARQKKATLINQ